MSNDAITEAERILANPIEHIVLVPYDIRRNGTDQWLNVFLDGKRVGYLIDSESDGGWAITLNRSWGAPRDVYAVYLTRGLAEACVYQELRP